MLEKAGEFWRHYKGTVVAIAMILIAVTWTYGMESKVPSIINPELKVNRAQLQVEVEKEQGRLQLEWNNLQAISNEKMLSLDKQDAIKTEIFNNLSVYASGGAINPLGVAVGCLALLGVGATYDNGKKDGVIGTKNKQLASLQSSAMQT